MKIQYFLYFLASVISQFSYLSAEGGEYKLKALAQSRCSIQTVGPIVREELHRFIKSAYYDRSIYFLETDLNPLQGLEEPYRRKRFFDTLKAFEKHGSGNCVGMSKFLKKKLKTSIGLDFKIIPSGVPQYLRQENMPKYPHAALILSCIDGYVLVDPSMNIPDPIMLTEGHSTLTNLGHRGIWKFKLNSSEEQIQVSADSSNPIDQPWEEKRKADSSYTYILKELRNPDHAISWSHFLNDRRVMIYPLTFPTEETYRLTINILKRQVEFTKTDTGGTMEPLFTLPFDKYLDEPKILEEFVTKKVANHLRVPRDILESRVANVLNRVATK